MLSHGLIDSPSLFGLHGISQALTHILHNKTFDELRIPFACTAVDIRSAQEFIMADSCVLDAVLATIAIPGIFPPVEIGNRLLVDGGILDPVPVALARWLSPKIPVVAICLTPAPESWVVLPPIRPSPGSIIPKQILEQFGRLKIGQAFNIFAQSIDITSRTLAELRLQIDHPDMIIRPDVDQYGLLDRVDPKDLIIRGEEAVEKRLKELHQTFSIKNKIFRQFQPSTQPGKLLQRRNNLVQKNKIQENDA
jgi:NTE family protein